MRSETHDEAETERFGERLARFLEAGSVVGLTGPLGAGKTALVRGIALGLGIDAHTVRSPTFVTATEYRGGRLLLHHIDLYRHDAGLPALDWLAELLDGDGVAVVEWFERLGDTCPADFLRIEIDYADAPSARRLEVHASGPRSGVVLAALVASRGAAAQVVEPRAAAGRRGALRGAVA